MQEWWHLRLFAVMVHADAVWHHLPYENKTLLLKVNKTKKKKQKISVLHNIGFIYWGLPTDNSIIASTWIVNLFLMLAL